MIKWTWLRSSLTIIIIYLFLGVHALSSSSQNIRHYFSSYNEMVRFFHQPTTQGVTFSPKPTQFYADVYHTQTLHEAITLCTYQSKDQDHALYKKSTVTAKKKSNLLLQPSELPNVEFETGSYHKNYEPEPETPPPLQWKIIAPTGAEEHSSVEYALKPATFYTFWESLERKGLTCSAQLSPRPDGKKSLQISLGDQEVCQRARSQWKERDQHARAECRRLAFMYEHCPWVLLDSAKEFHDKRLKYVLKKLNKDLPQLALSTQDIKALAPPMVQQPTPHYQTAMLQNIKTGEVIEKTLLMSDQEEVHAYNKSLLTHIWLCAEIKNLTKKLSSVYWGNPKRIARTLFGHPQKKHLLTYAHTYIQEVDHIREQFYTQYPELKTPPFTAVKLSHPITHQLALNDTQKLAALHSQWSNASQQKESHDNQKHRDRACSRYEALEKSLRPDAQPYDYRDLISPHAPFTDPDAALFDNCYGSALDHQLHQELCDVRIQMYDLHTQLPDNRHVQAYLPIINATTAQAKAEKCPERAYHLADFSHDLIELVSRGVDFLKNYAGDALNRAYERTVQRCEAIKAGGNDDLDIKSCLHNLSNAYAQPAQAALTGGEAIARGIYQGVAQLADRTYWKNRALGMVEAIKFVGSILAEDVWLESWETEYRTAVVTDNQKACDQLLERFEKHEFQPLSSAEQGIRQACMQLQTLSWDQLVEHGAQLTTSLALDCLILKAGEFALSPAGRAFMHDVAETLKLPKTKAQKHMVELAGIGKIALEESSEVATAVVKSIQKNSGGLTQEGKDASAIFEPHKLPEGSLAKTNTALQSANQNIRDSVRKLDLNFLDEMEKVKGHTLQKHVGKPDQELIKRSLDVVKEAKKKRLPRPSTESISSFYNKARAIDAVQQNLRNNIELIAEWLKDAPYNSSKAFNCKHSYDIGRGVTCGKKGGIAPFSNSRIILTKSNDHPLGFIIKTAFPIEV